MTRYVLIKTEKFDRKFNSDLHQIILYKYKPINKRGSYWIKSIGSIITDIDLAQNVIVSQDLLNRILVSLQIRESFIFIRLSCGTFDDFRLPWNIDSEGGCDYDPKKALLWLKSVEDKVDSATYSRIEEKLTSDKMEIKNLFDIKKIIRPYSEILWDENDIKTGYKLFFGKKYYLLDLMKKGHVTIMRYLYKYESSYCTIDFSLVDRQYIKEPSILHEYYRQDDYKIFKSYKWYIKKEYFQEFTKALQELEQYTGKLSQIHLVGKAKEFKLLPMDEIKRLERENKVSSESLTKKIRTISRKYISYFQDRIQDKFRPMLETYNLRANEAIIPVSRKNMENRLKRGVKCPFFGTDPKEFRYLRDLAKKLFLDPEKLLACCTLVSDSFDIDIKLLINTVFSNNNLFIVLDRGTVRVKNTRGEILKSVYQDEGSHEENIKKAQLYILNYFSQK